MVKGTVAEVLAIATVVVCLALLAIPGRLIVPAEHRRTLRESSSRFNLMIIIPIFGAALIGLFGLALVRGGGRGTYLDYLSWWGRLSLPPVILIGSGFVWVRRRHPEMFQAVGFERARIVVRKVMSFKRQAVFFAALIVSGAVGAVWAGQHP